MIVKPEVDSVNVELIEDFMKVKGLSKSEFSERCMISMRTLNNILLGKHFALLSLIKVAKVMEVHVDRLVSRTA